MKPERKYETLYNKTCTVDLKEAVSNNIASQLMKYSIVVQSHHYYILNRGKTVSCQQFQSKVKIAFALRMFQFN